MKAINGKVSVELTVEEVTAINNLIKRDEAIAIIAEPFDYTKSTGEEVHTELYSCPICNLSVSPTNCFCSHCGQRLDTDNIAL